MTDMSNEETLHQTCQYIDDNVFCSAEEHCRALKYQLNRVQKEQRYLREWVNETMNPAIQEIRDTLRE